MNEKQCVRCGRAGHDSAECKWLSVAKALESCDWSGAPIGNKAIILQAIELLRTEQAQQAEPVAWRLFKQALFVGMERACLHYLMANAHGRCDGALKAHNHEQLCRHVIAAVRGCNPDQVRWSYEGEYKAVHDGTQALTSYLDEVIGFPLDSRPDYDDLTPKFFDKFFELAMASLGVSPVAQPPAVPVELRSVFDQMFDYSVDPTDDVSREWLWRFSKNLVGRLSSKQPVVAVPDGYALVPIEPTPKMLVAINWPNDSSGYRAMLAAAPQGADPIKRLIAVHNEPVASVKIGSHAPIFLGSDGLRIECTPSGALKVTCTREHAPSVDVENAEQSNRITDEQLAADGYLNATASALKGGA